MSPTLLPNELRRFDASQGPRKIGAGEGPVAELGGCDARFLVWSEESGDEPCRILEVISPGGFEHFFREFDETTKAGSFDPVALGERYGIEFDLEAVPRICAEHGLVHPLLDAGSDSSR